MEEERLAVLRMLQEGKITVEEAAALLEALAEGSSPLIDAAVEPGNKVEEKLRRVKDLSRSGVIEENVLSAVENVLRTVSEKIDEAFDFQETGPGS
ncbi:MAG: SHOCT-like domain-containing protein [Syntrophothermus sp.]